jgi:GTP1/Obg family GTP-binding protein
MKKIKIEKEYTGIEVMLIEKLNELVSEVNKLQKEIERLDKIKAKKTVVYGGYNNRNII